MDFGDLAQQDSGAILDLPENCHSPYPVLLNRGFDLRKGHHPRLPGKNFHLWAAVQRKIHLYS